MEITSFYKFQKKKYQMTMSKKLILYKIMSLNNNNLKPIENNTI